MLNENQHKLLQDPKVQLIIDELQCEVYENPRTRNTIHTRVHSWLSRIRNHKYSPRLLHTDAPPSQSDTDVKAWLKKQHQIHGKSWTPF